MGKSPDILLEEKEKEMLKIVEEMKLIQCQLINTKRFLEIKIEFLKKKVGNYKELQANLQIDASDKSVKIGKYLEFYDYPKLDFKINGEDFFAKPSFTKASEGKEEK